MNISRELPDGRRSMAEIPSPLNKRSVLDGYGVRHSSLIFDLKCLLGTVTKVGHDDTVVEGGTGAMEKKQKNRRIILERPQNKA